MVWEGTSGYERVQKGAGGCRRVQEGAGGGSKETRLHVVGHGGTAAVESLDNVVRSTTATPIPALRC